MYNATFFPSNIQPCQKLRKLPRVERHNWYPNIHVRCFRNKIRHLFSRLHKLAMELHGELQRFDRKIGKHQSNTTTLCLRAGAYIEQPCIYRHERYHLLVCGIILPPDQWEESKVNHNTTMTEPLYCSDVHLDGIKALKCVTHKAYLLINVSKLYLWGPGVAQWLRYCATSRTFPVVSLGIFSVVPSNKTMCLRSTQPLKMSTRDFSWGKACRCVWLTTYHPFSTEIREDPGP